MERNPVQAVRRTVTYVFLNRRGHQVQMTFWDRSGYCIVKKRLEAGTFRLVRAASGEATHVEIDAAELALMLEGIELRGATRRKRFRCQAKEDKKKNKRRRQDRTTVANGVERIVHPPRCVEGEERMCPECGGEKDTFGFVEHQRIEIVPAKARGGAVVAR
ncbi:IS66 family insertion sequence element accessory protein TnpB [Pendulispora albinea]|uniref:IS66 family insertion sequence element accessory protein TnpB n=1 Tax=Pendulispora albinea TaxID=2741071 RepID=UPI00374E101D